jgi:hypothetical protein
LKEDISQQAKDFANAKVDSAKQVVKDTLQGLKKEAIREVSEQLKNQLLNRKDSLSTNNTEKPGRRPIEGSREGNPE